LYILGEAYKADDLKLMLLEFAPTADQVRDASGFPLTAIRL
jgi:hypothetical protein